LLRDYQMHPVRNTIQHIDFQRVSATEKIHVKVPLHFINAEIAPGVKLGGGIVAHVMTEVDIACLPKDLPEYLEVDLANLEVAHSIHLSELTVPAGVEFVQLSHGTDPAVATITKPRGPSVEEEAADAAISEAASAASAEAAAEPAAE
jgi:large subunit ribosomal protein L25